MGFEVQKGTSLPHMQVSRGCQPKMTCKSLRQAASNNLTGLASPHIDRKVAFIFAMFIASVTHLATQTPGSIGVSCAFTYGSKAESETTLNPYYRASTHYFSSPYDYPIGDRNLN